MLRLAMVMKPVFTQMPLPGAMTSPMPPPMSAKDCTERLTRMIERLGISTEPFPTLLTHAITLCAVAYPSHPVSIDWLSRYSTDFMQDYHQSLCELLDSRY